MLASACQPASPGHSGAGWVRVWGCTHHTSSTAPLTWNLLCGGCSILVMAFCGGERQKGAVGEVCQQGRARAWTESSVWSRSRCQGLCGLWLAQVSCVLGQREQGRCDCLPFPTPSCSCARRSWLSRFVVLRGQSLLRPQNLQCRIPAACAPVCCWGSRPLTEPKTEVGAALGVVWSCC